jgi:PAS domain S-box-containing protein
MIKFESQNLLLMQIVNQSSDGILIADSSTGAIIFSNETACKMLGYSTDEIQKLTFLDLHPKDWLETAQIKFKETNDSKIVSDIPLKCKDGQLIRADIKDFKFVDGDNKYNVAIITNITDKQQISEALEQSQARNAALLYSLPDYFFIVDKRFVILDYHAPDTNLLYTNPENFLNKKITEVMPKSVSVLLNETLNKAFQTGKIFEIEYKLEIKGKLNYFEARFFPTSENEVMIIVREVNEKTREKKTILKLLNISEEFLQIEDKDIDYRTLTDYALEVSGAEYAILNLFDESGLTFTTVAISGINNYIIKATEILGYEVVGKKWNFDELKHKKVKDNHVTVFKSLGDLSGDVIPSNIIRIIEKTFKLG